MTLQLPKTIAHRGASGSAPENTMVAFERAVTMGAQAIELDVTLSADGVPIVMHDETLERTTNGEGPVILKSWADLSELDAGSWFAQDFGAARIPTLQEVLAFGIANDVALNLEIKPTLGWEGPTVKAMVDVLRDSSARTVVSSFNERALDLFHTLLPKANIAVLVDVVPPHWAERLDHFDTNALHASDPFITQALVDELAQAGVTLRVFTVNDPKRAQQLWSWGVASVFTDFPDKLVGQV
ncbi:glycerophosphodiester phosphodiesterase family protein [Magnetovibrio sp. PR-2]|uniref:glycerophosphodiester phosphodiesterase family protein n=1 Tax=Magnetovibrio sp. PR-2 TaxID=3120356 RepID=UPI002FCE61E2